MKRSIKTSSILFLFSLPYTFPFVPFSPRFGTSLNSLGGGGGGFDFYEDNDRFVYLFLFFCCFFFLLLFTIAVKKRVFDLLHSLTPPLLTPLKKIKKTFFKTLPNQKRATHKTPNKKKQKPLQNPNNLKNNNPRKNLPSPLPRVFPPPPKNLVLPLHNRLQPSFLPRSLPGRFEPFEQRREPGGFFFERF